MPVAPRWNAFGFMCSFFFALFIVALLSEKNVSIIFIVLGQGHFLLTYMYQWRAGKIGPIYLSLYALASISLLTAFSFVPNPQLWTLVAAGSIFAVHFFVDEMQINSLAIGKEAKLLGAAFVLMYSALLIRYAYELNAPVLIAVLAIAACIPLIVARVRAGAIHPAEMFFLAGIGTLIIMLFIPATISLVGALGFIILFHYMRWYLYYAFRFGGDADQTRYRRYLLDVAGINALIIVLYILYVLVPALGVLGYLFEPAYFFAWTILHVLFSIRLPKRKSA